MPWLLFLVLTAAACGADGSNRRQSSSEDLRQRAAELLPDVERLSALPARGPLRLGIRSREELAAHLETELQAQFSEERTRNLMRVYTRFGLVSDTLDLESLLERLLLEQVAGFYDPASDTLFLVDGISEELVDGVLVHEMVHALQDQYVDLDSLVEASRHSNDLGMAVQAAIEGHATLVMFEWMLGEMLGRNVDLSDLPRFSESLGSEALGTAGLEMPELQQAPAVIREQLLFPYVAGLRFLEVRWGSAGGRTPPVGEALPRTTEQVLHPIRWGAPEVAIPAPLVFASEASGAWTEIHRDDMGEADIRILLREFSDDRERADAAARGWDGDVYRLLEGPSGETLIWVSRWDDAREADDFAAAVTRALARRYEGVTDRSVRVERFGDRGVRVVDTPRELGEVPGELIATGVAE